MIIMRITFRPSGSGMVASLYDIYNNRAIGQDHSFNINHASKKGEFLDATMQLMKDNNYPCPHEYFVDRCEWGYVKVLCFRWPKAHWARMVQTYEKVISHRSL